MFEKLKDIYWATKAKNWWNNKYAYWKAKTEETGICEHKFKTATMVKVKCCICGKSKPWYPDENYDLGEPNEL